MGTFANLYHEKGTSIPNGKIEEFKKRLEILYQAGGMMELERVSLFGKTIGTIRKVAMHEYGMDFYYNYFEDDCWENAGFSIEKNHVWSGKIGWRQFHRVVVAAYVLEELYTDGTAIAMVDDKPVTVYANTGWINYLFQENYYFKNRDPWKLFETMYKDEDDYYLERTDWQTFMREEYGVLGYIEIYAVLNGTEAAIAYMEDFISGCEEKEDEQQGGFGILNCAKAVRKEIEEFKKTSSLPKKKAALFLVEMLRKYYEQDSMELSIGDGYDDKVLRKILLFTAVSDIPAYVFKAIAETFEMDFWELWERFSGVARRRISEKKEEYNHIVKELTTMEFFHQSPDDMIPYWKPDGSIKFSVELQSWFQKIKKQFDALMQEEIQITNPLRWIVDLMVYADEEYYNIYTFSDFFEETIENLADKKYIVLWKIYEDMLYNPELEEAGSVIFVPEGSEHEHEGLHYWGEQPRRRLITSWDMMEEDKQCNKARVTLRRYMALAANKELRKEILGF
ncbi:MAG: hypothetical protein NC231_08170 [Bacillus sp. (in: Bacteria)]|nr:hypothetical protein [Bacillus sp. (in: firmicutes)]MCM1426250.1 hypothetical protein [Eubacterium sp.]